jgi:hypothetical protein
VAAAVLWRRRGFCVVGGDGSVDEDVEGDHVDVDLGDVVGDVELDVDLA